MLDPIQLLILLRKEDGLAFIPSVCWSCNKQCSCTNFANDSSDTWCCNGEYEECTQTSGQINVCWAKTFKNPNASVPPSAAASIASSMIAASQTSALNSKLSVMSASASTTKSHSSSATATPTPGYNKTATESTSGGTIADICHCGNHSYCSHHRRDTVLVMTKKDPSAGPRGSERHQAIRSCWPSDRISLLQGQK